MRYKHIPLDTFKVDSGFYLLVTITTASPNNYHQIVGSDYMKTTPACDRHYLWKSTNDLSGRTVYMKTGLESVSQTSLSSGGEELFSYNPGR